MPPINRYLKIYRHFIRQSLIRELQYSSNWIMSNLSTLSWSLMRLMYYAIVFSVTATVGEWTYERSLILAGTFMIVHAVQKGILEDNLRNFVSNIYTGELDLILLKPLSSQFIMSARVITPRASIRLLIGLVLTLYGFVQLDAFPSVTQLLSYFVMLIVGLVIMYSLGFLILTLSFWVGNVESIVHVPQVFNSMSYMPFNIFPKAINEFLTFVFPLMFITTIPVQTLFDPSPSLMLLGISLASCCLYASHLLWQKGLKSYSSVSS